MGRIFSRYKVCKGMDDIKKPCKILIYKALCVLAEREGFEPPDLLQSTVFKTAAFDRSAISPGAKLGKQGYFQKVFSYTSFCNIVLKQKRFSFSDYCMHIYSSKFGIMMLYARTVFSLFVLLIQLSACAQKNNYSNSKTFKEMNNGKTENSHVKKLETATFAAGCFWCVEAQYQQLEGVEKVESGYIGGHIENPTYKQVCTGTTGHAEACNVYFDPSKISYDELLAAFWQAHDPTQLNRQGNDVGTQYRSAIFYHNNEQKKKAEDYKRKLNEEQAFNAPVVTEISPYTRFYKAEDYHQNYYNENGSQSYCVFVVKPKLEKFQKVFKDKLKASK
jgi:peptide-methionine (S)-S-oxide reductase